MILTKDIMSKIRLNHFQLLTVSLVGSPVYECVKAENTMGTGSNDERIISKCKTGITSKVASVGNNV